MKLPTFRRAFTPQRDFDPSKKEDLLELKYFNENGNWKNGCPFYVEEPFIEIPAMCYFKYTEYMLSKMKVSIRKEKSPN